MKEADAPPPLVPETPKKKLSFWQRLLAAFSGATKGVGGKHPFTKSIRKNRLQLILIYLVVAIVLISGGLYFVLHNVRGGILVLDTTKNLKISVNGKEVKAKVQDEGYFLPEYAGAYRIEIEKPNYLPFKADLQVTLGHILKIRPAYAFQPLSTVGGGDTVDFVRPSSDQKAVFYLGNNRKTIYRMEVADQIQIPLTPPEQPLVGVSDVQWSSESDVALITQADGVYLREIPQFNFRSQILYKMGGNEISSPIWDPLNPERIAMIYAPATGEKSLVFSDKRATQLDRKADVRDISNPKLIWSKDDAYILLIGRSADYSKNNIWLYTTADSSLKQITQDGNVLDASFSPNNDTILYESYSSDPDNTTGSALSLMQVDGSNKQPLQINGKVTRTAWRDNDSFYIPNPLSNTLTLYTKEGKSQVIPFSFPDTLAVEGMFYFPSGKNLIFYTKTSIYTINLES